MRFTLLSLLASAGSIVQVHAQVKGSATGFAAGTTGGGSATPQTPSSLAQLKTWLEDGTPRVIMIDRTWDFRGTEGSTNGRCCNDNRTSKCPGGTSQGQPYIQDTCDNGDMISCTYDNAARKPIEVGSNKSIVGVGNRGAIRGKGLRVRGGKSNVIIQNVHFYDLNPRYVWGGDAITIDGGDRVWIDHCKFSLVGRQFIVTGWGAAGRVTISNNEFDGKTTWSSGCNGKHYWSLLLIGERDQYTFVGNWLHDLSGRAPHVGTTNTNSQVVFHAVNNYFQNIDGHAFDIDGNTWLLIEGNYFENVKTPITADSLNKGGNVYVVNTVAQASGCSGPIGKICEWNRIAGSSGALPTLTSSAALSRLGQTKSSVVGHRPVADVPASVRGNAGIGRI
ncbi:hypothetical protein F66182_2958 [Fusarium sp. NRRL 66182]|nr:hypothetical protein F66182_2958 [Fusarium sp. NRRL 66182]